MIPFHLHDQDALREAMIALDGKNGRLPEDTKFIPQNSYKKERLQRRRDALYQFISINSGVYLKDMTKAFPQAKINTIRGDLQALTMEGRIESQLASNGFKQWTAK